MPYKKDDRAYHRIKTGGARCDSGYNPNTEAILLLIAGKAVAEKTAGAPRSVTEKEKSDISFPGTAAFTLSEPGSARLSGPLCAGLADNGLVCG